MACLKCGKLGVPTSRAAACFNGDTDMAKIIKGNFSYICGNCHASFSLLGILPDIATLKGQGWKYCPKCGEPIEYELTRVVEEEIAMHEGTDEI